MFDALFLLALPLTAAYALMRHRLFDLEIKIRWTMEKSTIAAAFVAAFFVVSKGAQELLEGVVAAEPGGWGGLAPVVGIVGASFTVFALHPLERFAQRLARRALPRAKPITEMSRSERLALYREQVELSWLDGRMERKERLQLDGLRAQLGLSTAESVAIEADAVRRAEPEAPFAPTADAKPSKRALRRRPTARRSSAAAH